MTKSAKPTPQTASKPRPKPAPLETGGERLSKRVAFLMHCSRREAEQYIEGGWVRVNGSVVEEPMARVSEHTVTIDPHASLMGQSDVTLVLHKPPGLDAMAAPGEANKRMQPAHTLLLPANHWPDDSSDLKVLKRHFAKLSACVPLELAASGLCVFTQDWRVLRKLTEDAAVMEHELLVEVSGTVAPEALNRMNHPPQSERLSLPPVKVSINSDNETATRLRFAIKGAHPGLIAHLCERADLEIVSIKRVRVGRVSLAQLPQGQWRYLLGHERF